VVRRHRNLGLDNRPPSRLPKMAFLILVIGDLHIPDRALDIPAKVNNHPFAARGPLC